MESNSSHLKGSETPAQGVGHAGHDRVSDLAGHGQPLLEGTHPRAPTLDAELLAGTDLLKLFVFGNETRGQARLIAALDNLGKGAAGAAVQNLNIMTGRGESTGLVIFM